MRDADLLVIEKINDTSITLTSCMSTSYKKPNCAANGSSGEWKLISNNSFDLYSNYLRVEFSRKLIPENPEFKPLSATTPVKMIFSYNSKDFFSKHDVTGGKGFFDLSFSHSDFDDSDDEDSNGNIYLIGGWMVWMIAAIFFP